jgi:hypothetical protein
MIKVFTTDVGPKTAGQVLTDEIELWQNSFTHGITIKNIHTNSNKFGWMIVITYTVNF